MEEILIVILQGILEFIAEIICYDLFDWIPYPTENPNRSFSFPAICFFYFVLGCLLAWLSILIFKYTLIRQSALRIGNLILAPITSAYIAQAIARTRSKGDVNILPRQKFWQSFWFTVGLVSVRFAYATR